MIKVMRFTIEAHTEFGENPVRQTEKTIVEVNAFSEKSALLKAQNIVDRTHYNVVYVKEL